MTDLLRPDVAAATDGAAAAAPVTRRRRRLRRALLGVVALAAVVLLSIQAGATAPSDQALDPDSASRAGMRAVVEVLRQHDVEVEVVRGIEALQASPVDADTTVVISDPGYLGPGAAERTTAHVADARRLVVLEPSDLVLRDLALPVNEAGRSAGTLKADCRSDVADPADELIGEASTYLTDATSTGSTTLRCFTTDETDEASGSRPAALVVVAARPAAPEAVVVGSATAFVNARVTEGSHAALALRALGASPRLVWYVPVATDVNAPGLSGEEPDPDRGVPDWFSPGVLLLTITFVAFAFARGRRMGRAVAEPLPVVVRAVETTEARGRLYRRAADTDRAAAALRDGTRARLAARVGLPLHAPPQSVSDLVAKLTGREPTDLNHLLNGPTPANDHDLLLLSQQLADLEESVRQA